MRDRNVMPPNNPEIDVLPTGITIGAQGVDGNDQENLINPSAINKVARDAVGNFLFQLVHTYGGEHDPLVTGVRIPFGGVRLEILKLTDGTAQWKKGDTVLEAYTARDSRAWPADLVTPTTSVQYNQVSYTTAADPVSAQANWTSIPFANFVSVKLTTVQPPS